MLHELDLQYIYYRHLIMSSRVIWGMSELCFQLLYIIKINAFGIPEGFFLEVLKV